MPAVPTPWLAEKPLVLFTLVGGEAEDGQKDEDSPGSAQEPENFASPAHDLISDFEPARFVVALKRHGLYLRNTFRLTSGEVQIHRAVALKIHFYLPIVVRQTSSNAHNDLLTELVTQENFTD